MSRIAELEIMLEESPDDPFIIYALAREYEKKSSTMQAILIYEYLINSHPKYIATYYHYAKVLHEAGNRTQGIALLEQGIEIGISENEMHAVGEMRNLLNQWTDHDDD